MKTMQAIITIDDKEAISFPHALALFGHQETKKRYLIQFYLQEFTGTIKSEYLCFDAALKCAQDAVSKGLIYSMVKDEKIPATIEVKEEKDFNGNPYKQIVFSSAKKFYANYNSTSSGRILFQFAMLYMAGQERAAGELINQFMKPNHDFQITGFNMEVFDKSDIEREKGNGRFGIELGHTQTFRAYDDDGIFYCKGTMKEGTEEEVFNWLMHDQGVTLLKFYDRKTGKCLDSIG